LEVAAGDGGGAAVEREVAAEDAQGKGIKNGGGGVERKCAGKVRGVD
jgi:hypothetical protein